MYSDEQRKQQPTPQEIANLCFSTFNSLPKTGKPRDHEWTVLAGVVLHNSQSGTNEVISLGCGTKCIGKSKLCTKGLILNDSHAEILARRSLLRYLYHHIKKALSDDCGSIFEWMPKKKKCKLKDGCSFHFLSTQIPCGDACIVDSAVTIEEPLSKKPKIDNSRNDDDHIGCAVDGVFTGAKLLGTTYSDVMKQVIGAVRTKPGRGERTLSMSCSDKLAKWQIMGVQGALLDILLQDPIYFQTLNFWGESGIIATLERAIWKRFEMNSYDCERYKLYKPKIQMFNSPAFEHAPEMTKQPSPNGLVWCNLPDTQRPYEISVNGKRQGVTKKKLHSPQAALTIARYNLFRQFMEILKLKPELVDSKNWKNKTYLDIKLMSTQYQVAWNEIKTKYFKQWSQKPIDNLKFVIADDKSIGEE